MANDFKPWVDNPTAGQEVQSASVFASDIQRIKGFKAGDPASALRVNSALRQANLVVASLMQMCDEIVTLPQGLGLLSTVTQVKNAIKAAIDKLDTTILNTAKSYTDTREAVINEKITDLQSQVTVNKDTIDGHTEHLTNIDEEIAALEGGSSTLTDRVETLETTVDDIPDTYATKNELAEAQSDINDIVSGAQTAKKAEQDTNGNVIDTTYAKLSQVVRTDAAQSLTDAQKNTVAQNIERSAERTPNDGVGWYNILTADINGNFVADVSVVSGFYNSEPTEVKIIAIGGYIESNAATRVSITCFSAGALSPFISKVRVRSTEGQVCIDAYIPFNTTTKFNNMRVLLNSWKDSTNSMPQVQPFTFVGTEDGTDNVSICEVIQKGISTNGQIYQQGAPVFATDPSKLAPSTANGWTQTTATGTLPTYGVYMVTPTTANTPSYGISILFYCNNDVSEAVVGQTNTVLSLNYRPNANPHWLLMTSNGQEMPLSNIYYKRIA